MELYYLCSENKGDDQLRGYREADLRLCFRICKMLVSHDAAHSSNLKINSHMSLVAKKHLRDFHLERHK